jgi:hypothetical protein
MYLLSGLDQTRQSLVLSEPQAPTATLRRQASPRSDPRILRILLGGAL